MKIRKISAPSVIKGFLLLVLASCVIAGSLTGFHSAGAQNSSPTHPVKSDAEEGDEIQNHSLVTLTFPVILYSENNKNRSHVQDAAQIQIAKVYPSSPQRADKKTNVEKHTNMPEKTSKSSLFTETMDNIRFVMIGVVLLILGGFFISSLLPQMSGVSAATGAQGRLADRLQQTTPKIYETNLGKLVDLSTSAYVDSAADKEMFTFEEESFVEDEYPLDEVIEGNIPVEGPGGRLLSVSLSSVPGSSPALMRMTKSFFQQNRFEFTKCSENNALLQSKLSQYQQYGDIPVFLIQNANLDDALVQEMYATMNLRGHNTQKKLAFVIVDRLPLSSAYEQIDEYATGKNIRFVPVGSQHIVKAVRTSRCPQALEKLMASVASRNEYENMTPVENPLEFFGRDELLDSLFNSVSHLQHIGLFGLRSIGKTSLIWQLRERLSQHVVAYIDLQQVPRDCNYLYREILKGCFRDAAFKYPELTLPDLHDLEKEKQENQSIRFIQTLIKLWEGLKAYRHDIKILLLLDEAEHFAPKLEEHEGGFSGFHEFMGIIRGLSQQYGFLVSVVGSSSPEISRLDTWKGQSNPGFQFYKEVFLTSLSEAGCNHMVTSLGAQMGLKYTEGALSRIYYETGGHPYVTRQLCSLITEKAGTPESPQQGQEYSLQSQDVEYAISEYIEYKSDYLSSVWQRLSPVEQDILLVITTSQSCALKDLISHEQDYDAKRQRRKAISTLIENELVEKCENKYSIKMGLFERFLLSSN
ncbi:MAG: ATP-binding protein [bacterium]|nr:ATP-binding protein [bacterium]